LDLLTALHVLPQWQTILSDPINMWRDYYAAPTQMLDLTESILSGTTDPSQVLDRADHWGEVSGLTGELPESRFYHAWCVYKTALCALDSACGVDQFQHARLNEATTAIEDVTSDAANWASIAFAGGTWVADPDGPIDDFRHESGDWNYDLPEVRARRLDFWTWWLLEAIPRARELAVSA
jgi:hypothetical protein